MFEKGDTVLSLKRGLSKRVLEIMDPDVATQSDAPSEPGIERIPYRDLLLIEPIRARNGLSVVAEAHERSKKQWGDAVPPYMRGFPLRTHYFEFPPVIDDEDRHLAK